MPSRTVSIPLPVKRFTEFDEFQIVPIYYMHVKQSQFLRLDNLFLEPNMFADPDFQGKRIPGVGEIFFGPSFEEVYRNNNYYCDVDAWHLAS